MYLELQDFIKIIKYLCKIIDKNKDELSNLDSVIGDGDHGITISRGFKSVENKLKEEKIESISELFTTTGLTLVSSMGGASGPLFGTFFKVMGEMAGEEKQINLKIIFNMFYAAFRKLCEISSAKPGDKTMIDSIEPGINSLRESLNNNLNIKEALYKMSIAAKNGAESTKKMVAKKGRARYHGDNSIGYQDAGATSMYLIIDSFYKAIK